MVAFIMALFHLVWRNLTCEAKCTGAAHRHLNVTEPISLIGNTCVYPLLFLAIMAAVKTVH